MVDTIPPKISVHSFSPDMTGRKQMSFKIWDNIRARDSARGLIYDAYVDGEWILMELDGKTGTISHRFDGRLAPGAHTLMINVTDDRGNVGTMTKVFTL
jgi:hypothetical protein